jgi:hypothetical protein
MDRGGFYRIFQGDGDSQGLFFPAEVFFDDFRSDRKGLSAGVHRDKDGFAAISDFETVGGDGFLFTECDQGGFERKRFRRRHGVGDGELSAAASGVQEHTFQRRQPEICQEAV